MKITLRVLSENPHIPQPKFKPKLLANQRSLTGHSLVIQGLQNDKDTLHEFMKIPGTHSKKSVFFLSDSLGSPYLTISPHPPPHTQVLLGKEAQSAPWFRRSKCLPCSIPRFQAPGPVFPMVWILRKDYASFNFPGTQDALSPGHWGTENKAQGMSDTRMSTEKH